MAASPYRYVITYTRDELLALAHANKPSSAQRARISYLREIIPEAIRPLGPLNNPPEIEVIPPPAPRRTRNTTTTTTTNPPSTATKDQALVWRRPSLVANNAPRVGGGGLVEQRTGNWRSHAWKGTRRRASAAREPWALRHALLVGGQSDWEDRLAVEAWRRNVADAAPAAVESV